MCWEAQKSRIFACDYWEFVWTTSPIQTALSYVLSGQDEGRMPRRRVRSEDYEKAVQKTTTKKLIEGEKKRCGLQS